MDLQMLSDATIPMRDAVCQLLQPRIAPFSATTSRLVDNNGHTLEEDFCVVRASAADITLVPIDDVAAIVDCIETLTVETLDMAYERIRVVKSMRKTDRPGPVNGDTHMTTCIIVARDSELSLEQISSEMDRLNAKMPSHYWPDATAVLTTGLINYSAHTPATGQSGDFFLPAEVTIARSPAPSIWVQKVIRPLGALTFNKVASLLVVRVAIFQPGVKVQDYRTLIKGHPSHGAATQAYQFNLANVLVPLTKEQAITAQLPHDTFNVVSGKKTLGSVQYQPWQDGGVFIVRGNFPLDVFLIFLNAVVPGLSAKDLRYFRGDDVQVSYVLPINQWQFLQTLAIFEQRSSNISIQKDKSKFLMQKIGDEGTTSPFIARLMLEIMGIRDAIYGDRAERLHFDELYEPILSGLRNAREIHQGIVRQWEEHRAKVMSGAIVKNNGRSVQISEHIDRSLKRDLETFLITTVRTIKHSLQLLAHDLGIEIGFLFQKQSSFETGINKTRAFDGSLADYLLATRQWTEPLVALRNDLEHGTIASPKVAYILDSNPVRTEEPQFAGKSISQFTTDVFDRVCCLTEELIVHCLRKKLPQNFEITEVARADRDPEAPLRFHVTVALGGGPAWVLTPHTKGFNEV